MNLLIGTLSVQRECGVNAPQAQQTIDALMKLIGDSEPVDLLVTAASYFQSKRQLREFSKLRSQSNNNRTYTIVSVGGLGDDLVFLVRPNGEISELAKQKFIYSEEYESVQSEFLKSLQRRYFKFIVGKKKLLGTVLICGEINAFSGRENVVPRHHLIESHFNKADIVINPTHDRMGNDGALIAKRNYLCRYLDSRNRCYVSVSNWETKTKNQTAFAKTLHTVYSSQFCERNETMEYGVNRGLGIEFELRLTTVNF